MHEVGPSLLKPLDVSSETTPRTGMATTMAATIQFLRDADRIPTAATATSIHFGASLGVDRSEPSRTVSEDTALAQASLAGRRSGRSRTWSEDMVVLLPQAGGGVQIHGEKPDSSGMAVTAIGSDGRTKRHGGSL